MQQLRRISGWMEVAVAVNQVGGEGRVGGVCVEEQGVVTLIRAILRAGRYCKTHLQQFVTKKSLSLSNNTIMNIYRVFILYPHKHNYWYINIPNNIDV